LDPETKVFQAADGKDLMILACTVFDWSTRVTNGQTERQTDSIAMIRKRCSSTCFRAQMPADSDNEFQTRMPLY